MMLLTVRDQSSRPRYHCRYQLYISLLALFAFSMANPLLLSTVLAEPIYIPLHRSSLGETVRSHYRQFGLYRERLLTRTGQQHLSFLTHASTSFDVESSSLHGCPFTAFTVPVQIGTTTFALLLDTGSSTLAVASNTCSSCQNVSPRWFQSSSTTMISSTRVPVASVYGDGSGWNGHVVSESVTIASSHSSGSSNSIIDSVRMQIGVIDSQSTTVPFFSAHVCIGATGNARTNIGTQGIIGFGFTGLAKANTDSFIEKLFASTNDLPKQFALQLCQGDGSLWLGGTNQNTFTGEMMYTPITDTIYYSVDPHDIAVVTPTSGGGSGGSEKWLGFSRPDWKQQGSGVIDSGTTMWGLPANIFNRLADLITADSYFRSQFPTSFFHSERNQCVAPTAPIAWEEMQRRMPKIRIKFTNGLVLTLHAGSYLMPCTSAYTSFASGIGIWSTFLGGWAFMHQFVTVFDLENRRMGFAPSRRCEKTVEGMTTVTMDRPLDYYTPPAVPTPGGPILKPPSTTPIITGIPATISPLPSFPSTVAATGGGGGVGASSAASTGPPSPKPSISSTMPEVPPVFVPTGDFQTIAPFVSSSSSSSTGSSIGPIEIIAAQIILSTTYSYDAFLADPGHFERTFTDEMYVALELLTSSLQRIASVIERPIPNGANSAVEIEFMLLPPPYTDGFIPSIRDTVQLLDGQIGNATSPLKSGTITRHIEAMNANIVSACDDGSFQSPCEDKVADDRSESSSGYHPDWYIILAFCVAAIFLIVILIYIGWCCCSQSRSRPQQPSQRVKYGEAI